MIQQTLSAFIIENFDQDTLDTVSESCEMLSFVQSYDLYSMPWDQIPSIGVFMFENYKTLVKVSKKVKESADTHEIEYDFNFEGINPELMTTSYYCFEDKRHYYVSSEMKMLIRIGYGIMMDCRLRLSA